MLSRDTGNEPHSWVNCLAACTASWGPERDLATQPGQSQSCGLVAPKGGVWGDRHPKSVPHREEGR